MAASWDVAALEEWGVGMGKEFRAKGSNVQLGPGLCLARVPRNGRNFEYLSGEDPMLGYELVQPVIRGIQSQGVIANAKHWVLNNQETNRGSVYDMASERVRFELYYPPFAGAIKAKVGSVMCSYNKVAGDKWSCENPETLATDLKQRLKFEGFVMSDWGATHSTSLAAGLDIEMPAAAYMNNSHVHAALQAGAATEAQVHEAVVRIFTPMFAVGVMDAPPGAWDWHLMATNATSEASVASARRLSAVSTVLLKNQDGLLPLPSGAAANGKHFCVLGFAADDNAVVHGGGSGSVVPSYIALPLTGVVAAVGGNAKVSYDSGANQSQAVGLARECDVAIVFVQTLSSEGRDRTSLSLDDDCSGSHCHAQNALVEAVAAANRNTVVVMSVPGAVLTPWRDQVAALLTNFMPGQQAGHAIADVLFGRVNPSGKLPLTFPSAENQTKLTPHQWPGWPDPRNPTYANYSEGLLVGYRYYDAHGIAPAYPFGHGLSYAGPFGYSALHVDAATGAYKISMTLTNTGGVRGAEVAQLYLAFPSSANEPPKVLRRFQKVELAPGESATVTFAPLVPADDLAIWDEDAHAYRTVNGEFGVLVGASSRDIRLKATFVHSSVVEAP